MFSVVLALCFLLRTTSCVNKKKLGTSYNLKYHSAKYFTNHCTKHQPPNRLEEIRSLNELAISWLMYGTSSMQSTTVSNARTSEIFNSKIDSTLLQHVRACNEILSLFPYHCVWAHSFFRRNVAAEVNRRQHCV